MSENEMKIPKIKLGNVIKHFCTITRHRLLAVSYTHLIQNYKRDGKIGKCMAAS